MRFASSLLITVLLSAAAVGGLWACGDGTEELTGGVDSGQVTDNGAVVEDTGGPVDDAGTVDTGSTVDTGQTDAGGEADASGDAGNDTDGPPIPDAGAGDAGWDAGYTDVGPRDAGHQDAGEADAGQGDAGGQGDGGSGDAGAGGPCSSWNDCPGATICDFALGRCERRASWRESGLALFAVKPPAAAAGDVLLMDGKNFSIMFDLSVKIGTTTFSYGQVGQDENRITLKVPAGLKGAVSVTTKSGGTVSLPEPLEEAPTGVIACDGTTPYAAGAPGANLGDTGPHAAGYVDFTADDTRLYYPAACGSVRRPAIKGTFPFVVLNHGNGAPYINYEYLAGMLATWGFVSIMPLSEMLQQYDAAVTQKLYTRIEKFRGRDLSSLHPALDGLGATEKVFFVGHSRGTMRSQDVINDHPDVKADAVGSAFIGPADNEVVMPGPFIAFSASLDLDSMPFEGDQAYNRQGAPRWRVLINGGNHGMYCDHRVYSIDRQPTITRKQELTTVLFFTFPLIQRAFGLPEPFAAQLDSPPKSSIYDVKFEL